MKPSSDVERRVTRLLRWYPPSWRERYAEEFSAHLEQEIVDRPVDRKRNINVAYKGLIARVGDMGFGTNDLSPERRTQSALGTSFGFVILTAVFALYFWSMTMLVWSSREYHPVPIDFTTGILTVAMAVLVLALIAIFVIILVSAIRQTIHKRGRPLTVPGVLAVISGAFLLYTVRWVPRFFAAYSHLRPRGFRWVHPGSAAYGLATIGQRVTVQWISLWNPATSGGPRSFYIENDFAPLALCIFAVSLAVLVRRIELPQRGKQMSLTTIAFFGSLSSVFLLTTVVWLCVGGPAEFRAFGFVGNIAGIVYLLFIGFVVVVSFRLVQNTRENRSGVSLIQN